MPSQGTTPRRLTPVTTACFLLFFLVGCAVPDTPPALPLNPPAGFSATGQQPLPDKWWHVFADETLNNLITRSLTGNFTLSMARARLEQARAVAGKSGAELLPAVSTEAALARSAQHFSETGESTFTSSSLGLAAGYEIDLWGRLRANEFAARLDLQAAHEDLQTAAVTLSAEVAITWYRLLEQQGQIALLRRQIVTNEQALDLVSRQFGSGQVPATDVLQQRQALEGARAALIEADTGRQLLVHQLAVLSGEDPLSFSPPTGTEPAILPPLPAAGLPADLLRRRPDIRRASLRLHAADQRIAAAIADRFPRISLTAGAEANGEPHQLFSNWLATLAGNLAAPLLDGGRRAFEVDRTRAIADEALHNYGQAIISAIREVEDALSIENRQRRLLENIESRLTLSHLVTKQTRERYIHGAMEFLRFLIAQLNEQELERGHLRVRRELIEARITLCRALAGGWEIEDNPPAHQAFRQHH